VAESTDSSGVRFPPPLLYAGALAAGFLVQRRWPIAILPGMPFAARIAGAILALAGAALAISAVGMFRRAGTSPNPTRPASALAVRGPYRFTRNPMYLGLALVSAGFALFWNALWPLVFLPVAILLMRRLVIDREERYLEEKFGNEYTSYKARVRRWV
jgi:protein-S-isoprenylcysteine O-methyltransferase Ste14